MRRRTDILAIAVAGLVVAPPAVGHCDTAGPKIVLRAERLSDALRQLSVRSGVDLLFAPDVVGSRRSPRIDSIASIDAVLQQLLAGSGLAFRRTGGGAIVIFVAPADEQTAAVPEILVVGHKTQNADIRRTENDIQPYQVAMSHDIVASHADDIDAFLRTRLPNDAEAQPPSLGGGGTTYGTNRSEVNLHGLGSDQTLVLIDGARMPGIPYDSGLTLEMEQPDLNAVPLIAIDRIETLTSTAGGIYGPGAIGGVINVVLKRDYRGADFAVTYGLSDRGDAPRRRIDARIGFTPDHGNTDVMLTFSRTVTQGLTNGDRDYATKARTIEIDQSPAGFVNTFRAMNGIIVSGFGNLSLNAAHGGASLNSALTYVPAGYGGVASDGGAALLANAGKIPRTLPQDGSGAEQSLSNNSTVTSVLFNARHRFSDNVEAFVDFLGFENNGSAVGTVATGFGLVTSTAPTNPFKQFLEVTFPLPGYESQESDRLRTFRTSAGVLVRLPHGWKADATFSLGGVREAIAANGYVAGPDLGLAMEFGQAGAGGEPVPNPFGDWNTFVAALQTYKKHFDLYIDRSEHFQDGSLRLAGPLFSIGAGPIALTLLAERRHEDVPTSTERIYQEGLSDTTQSGRGFSQLVSSLYGELRAPLVPRDAGLWPLRGLEVQLAIRYDDNQSVIPSGTSDWLRAHEGAVAYTAGLRVFPQEHLMLRASISTGVLPPTPDQLEPGSMTIKGPIFLYTDPRRGRQELGTEGPWTALTKGSLGLKPERARSITAGFVLNPDGGNRPRLSIDYTHIDKRNEILELGIMTQYILDHEDMYPGRVTRAPLTAADAAAGYTVGVVTQVDGTYLEAGRTKIDAVDLRADYAVAIGASGTMRVYAAATWQPRLKRWMLPMAAPTEYVGFADGPLKWRGNVGAEWAWGPFTIGLNGQYYGRYYAADASAGVPDYASLNVPGVRVPPQVYLDLATAYRFTVIPGSSRQLELRFGVQNLLGHVPPIVTNTNQGFSTYGDPRGRRFEATAAFHF